jgi:fatty acid desaturase
MRGEGERALRAQGNALARKLAIPASLRSSRDLSLNVSGLAMIYALLLYTGFHWVACVLAFLVVGKVQHSLLLSGHEAIHYSLFRDRRWNELVGRYMCFSPMGAGFHRSRAAHLDHHNYLSTERDEKIDFQLVKQTKQEFLWHMLCPLFGSYLWKGLLRLAGHTAAKRARPTYKITTSQRRGDLVSIGMSSIILIGVLCLFDWRLYLYFWAAPLLTTTAALHHAKAFLDHANLPGASEETLYSYRVTWMDRMFFGVQQARHAEHHLWPRVPYIRLARFESIVARMPNVKGRGGYFVELARYYHSLKS